MNYRGMTNRNNAPLKFATTLNQVDCDRGYTNFQLIYNIL